MKSVHQGRSRGPLYWLVDGSRLCLQYAMMVWPLSSSAIFIMVSYLLMRTSEASSTQAGSRRQSPTGGKSIHVLLSSLHTRIHRPDSDKTRPSHCLLEQDMSHRISQAPQTQLAQNYADMLMDMQTRLVTSRRSRKSSFFSQPFAPSPLFYPSHCSRWVMSV